MILGVSSNIPSFNTVEFKKGLNIIVAERSEEASNKDSRNSLGKTTLIEIIDFCLGGNATPERLLSSELNDSTFTLDLKLGDEVVSVCRNTKAINDTDIVKITGNIPNLPVSPSVLFESNSYEISLGEWKRALGYYFFDLSISEINNTNTPNFRSLIPYFIRKSAEAYTYPFTYFRKSNDIQKQLYSSFLIGLDWKNIRDWANFHNEKKRITDLEKALKDAGKLKALGIEPGTIGELKTKRTVQENEVIEQKKRLDEFIVHPEYRRIERTANELTEAMHTLENKIIVDSRLLNFYKNSLKDETPPDTSEILDLYKEVGVLFPDSILKRFKEVELFHQSLVKNRGNFLADEIKTIQQIITDNQHKLKTMGEARSEQMGVLRTQGALDEHNKLQQLYLKELEKLREIKRSIDRLNEFQKAKKEINQNLRNVLARIEHDYDDKSMLIEKAISFFAANSGALYNSPGEFVIEIFDNIKKNVMGFKAHIEGGADVGGIAQMTVFCYDIMIAQLRSGIGKTPGFLIHDSAIFADVDERQKALGLQLLAKVTETYKFQYILTLNSDNIPYNDLPDGFNINDYVRLVLSDETDERSLLGFRFDNPILHRKG